MKFNWFGRWCDWMDGYGLPCLIVIICVVQYIGYVSYVVYLSHHIEQRRECDEKVENRQQFGREAIAHHAGYWSIAEGKVVEFHWNDEKKKSLTEIDRDGL